MIAEWDVKGSVTSWWVHFRANQIEKPKTRRFWASPTIGIFRVRSIFQLGPHYAGPGSVLFSMWAGAAKDAVTTVAASRVESSFIGSNPWSQMSVLGFTVVLIMSQGLTCIGKHLPNLALGRCLEYHHGECDVLLKHWMYYKIYLREILIELDFLTFALEKSANARLC